MPTPDSKTPIPLSAAEQAFCQRSHTESYADAKLMLGKIFQVNTFPARLNTTSKIKVLVPCAGMFPSYLPLVETLCKFFRNIKTIDFTLVDLDAKDLALFKQYSSTRIQDAKGIGDPRIDILTESMSLEKFINKSSGNFFDLVYFEHPDISSVATFITKLSHLIFNNNSSTLSGELPHLSKVLQQDSVVIAICKTREEQAQMQRLLRYSLNLETRRSSIACNLVYPRDFCKGLFAKHNQPRATDEVIHAKVKQTSRSESQLLLFVMLSAFIYYLRYAAPNLFWQQSASLLLMFAQFAFHKPNPNGLGVKILIVASQLALLCSENKTDHSSAAQPQPPRPSGPN